MTLRAADYLEEIVWSFRKQKLRTLLTASGIGIGAFALALMVGLGAGLRVEVARRLVREQDRRVVHERSRDRDALTLTARELVRTMRHARR